MTQVERIPSAPGRAALSLYRAAPGPVRAHLRVRWATCPFPAAAEAVPTAGRVLEVGCGHGLFSAYLAAASPARSVRGIDVDEQKIRIAERAAEQARARGADLAFEAMPPGELPAGTWDAVAIVDVLYLIGAAAQRRLLWECASRLAPGGVLAVKEMSLHPRWKFLWNLVQETVSVRVLGITRGGRFTFTPPDRIAAWMRQDGLEVRQRSLQRGYVHPHHLVAGRRPGE